MIVFDLVCPAGHRFEGWFASSAAFDHQANAGLVSCAECGATPVVKAPMAPAVGVKANRAGPAPAKVPDVVVPAPLRRALEAVAKQQVEALRQSTWVGDRFAGEARSQHYGETEELPIHGRATREEAEALADEGIAVVPIVVPFAPPDEIN